MTKAEATTKLNVIYSYVQGANLSVGDDQGVWTERHGNAQALVLTDIDEIIDAITNDVIWVR